MPRTDREIFEYMEYYNTKEERKWALENLARVEKKSEEEIRAICEKFKKPRKAEQKPAKTEQKPSKAEQKPAKAEQKPSKAEQKPAKTKGKPRGINAPLTEEKREEIREALRNGASLAQGAKLCGVSSSAVGRIRLEMQANGEKLPEKNIGGRKCTDKYKREHPEPVAEPVVEPVVETVEPVAIGSESIYRFEDVCAPIPPKQQLHAPAKNEWFAIRDVLSDTALGIFGKGAEITYQAVDCIGGNVSVSVRTADGIDIMFTAERSA